MTTLLKEPAVSFFLLLRRAIELDAVDDLRQINNLATPHMKKNDRTRLIRKIQKLTEEKKPVTIETIRKDREQLRKRLKGGML